MSGYGNFDGYYPNDDGGDPLPADGSGNDDPNDDFDPLELLQSPLFGENRGGGGSETTGGGNNDNEDQNEYGVFSGQQQQQQQGMSQMARPQSSLSPSSPPFPSGGFGAQAQSQGPAGFPQQFGGTGMQQQGNMNMQNMNPSAMNNNFRMQGGNQMGNPMQGGMNVNVNPAAMNQMGNQMGQMQGMQQALQMQAAAGNPMQGNPMMNPMQAGGPGGQLMGANPNMQGMGPGGPMTNMPGGMNSANRNGSLNTAVSNLNGSMNGLNVSGNQNGTGPAFLGNVPSMPGGGGGGGAGGFGPQPRSGSLPTSPNGMPSVAQLSASIRAGNSSRSGGRTRGPTPKVDVNGKVIANTSSDPGINEAMEKLCESMRRSAMSRNLVKQLSGSGRNLQRSGSGRSLSRSNSGVGMRKQMSGRSLSGNLKGMGDDGSGRGTPTRTVPIRRLSNSKHRLHQRAAPGNRGALRTNSMGSQPRTFLQLDDQSLGAL